MSLNLMVFIIAEIVYFNPEDGTLTHSETSETVKLTITASRLLEYFLSSDELLLDREKILKEVWDAHGYQGSNSSLNQYISILRRTLAAFGFSDFIITVPKVGFRIDPAISVTLLPAPPAVHDESAQTVVSHNAANRRRKKQAILVGLLLISAALCFYLQSALILPFRVYQEQLNDKCSIIFMKDLDGDIQRSARKNINAILAENKVVCDKNQRIIFDSNDSFTTHSAGRTLLSICTTGKNNQTSSCDNFFYNSRKNL